MNAKDLQEAEDEETQSAKTLEHPGLSCSVRSYSVVYLIQQHPPRLGFFREELRTRVGLLFCVAEHGVASGQTRNSSWGL